MKLLALGLLGAFLLVLAGCRTPAAGHVCAGGFCVHVTNAPAGVP